jgi:hypothetical protein
MKVFFFNKKKLQPKGLQFFENSFSPVSIAFAPEKFIGVGNTIKKKESRNLIVHIFFMIFKIS